MLETTVLTVLFALLLVAAGIIGEVSGFRAFVCSRNFLGVETKIGANRRSLPGRQPLARLLPHTTHIAMESEIDCEHSAGTLFCFLSSEERRNKTR